jgi:hypothetical protein
MTCPHPSCIDRGDFIWAVDDLGFVDVPLLVEEEHAIGLIRHIFPPAVSHKS